MCIRDRACTTHARREGGKFKTHLMPRLLWPGAALDWLGCPGCNVIALGVTSWRFVGLDWSTEQVLWFFRDGR
eukprot:5298734-Alexandrium_andersonii.AAC.1